MSETGMTTDRRDEELPERWSAQRKTEVVLRVVRGEAIDEVAREIRAAEGSIPGSYTWGDKRVHRLYREDGLGLRRRKPKRRRAAMARAPRPAATAPNERWTMDFMSDALASGQQLRVLTVVDTFTREDVALEGGTQFRGTDVARVLSALAATRGLQQVIQCDNGTEFTSLALDQWAWAHGVQLDFSRPGKPTDNATIESFNASVRRECLSEHYFSTLAEARVVLGLFRDEYNNHDRTAA